MYDWVTGGQTILVSLGSHLPVDKEYAQAMLQGFRLLIARRPEVRVLWKLRKYGENFPFDSGDERIRITEWLDVDPTTILPHVACVVNHGGSNSYHEALSCVFVFPWWDRDRDRTR
jgi:UDP:flavonoid glycosyltransferase YjiC (YdhE family)